MLCMFYCRLFTSLCVYAQCCLMSNDTLPFCVLKSRNFMEPYHSTSSMEAGYLLSWPVTSAKMGFDNLIMWLSG